MEGEFSHRVVPHLSGVHFASTGRRHDPHYYFSVTRITKSGIPSTDMYRSWEYAVRLLIACQLQGGEPMRSASAFWGQREIHRAAYQLERKARDLSTVS